MALEIGDQTAASGMTKAIYDKLNEMFQPKVPPANLADAQAGWRNLAFAIATGVVSYLLSNLEITGLTVGGSLTLPVSGSNASGNASLTQSGATTGLVR